LKEGGKTPGSVRAVPLRKIVVDALDAMTPGSTRRSCSPPRAAATSTGRSSGTANGHRRSGPPGIDHRRLYDCRHTFATWAIESGVQLFYLATIMGTSIVQLEDTYARWLTRTDDQPRAACDAYDAISLSR